MPYPREPLQGGGLTSGFPGEKLSSSVRSAGSQLSRTSESKTLGPDHRLHQAQNRGLGSGLFQQPNKATSVTKQMLVILRAPQQTEERLLCAIINLPKKPLAFSKVPPCMRSSFTPSSPPNPPNTSPLVAKGSRVPQGWRENSLPASEAQGSNTFLSPA